MSKEQLIEAVRELIADQDAPLSLVDFVNAYDRHRPDRVNVFRFAALAVQYGSDVDALRPAIGEALQHGFLSTIWTTLLERIDFGGCAAPITARVEAIGQALIAVRFKGTMQQVVHPGGFGRVKAFPALDRAATVTGLIKVKTPAGLGYGTGFLVGADLLMTAAHVIQSQVDDHGIARPGSADAIVVEFHNVSQPNAPIRCRVAETWLEAMSPPLGAPPLLSDATIPGAHERLDFALIRLADPVGERLGFLDIRTPPTASAPSWLAVIGYPGGADCLWDARDLTHVDAGARIRYGANTLPGMSGSPCLEADGRVIAIHEGAVTAPPPEYNRSVELRWIREMLRTQVPDPLDGETKVFSVEDADALQAWMGAAQEWRGGDGEALAEWLDELPVAGEAMHPVFGRTEWRGFVREARGLTSERRVAFVTGPRWSGKSFSLRLLRAVLRLTPAQLVSIGPETLRLSLEEVLEKIAIETAASRPAPASEPASSGLNLRPAAGVTRMDLLPPALSALQAVITARPERAQQLWITLDFGTPQQLAPDLLSDWKQWLIAASKLTWLRVVVIGLREPVQKEFAAALPAGSFYVETLASGVTFDEFHECFERLLRQVAPAVAVAGVQSTIAGYWNAIEDLGSPQGRVLQAVHAALSFRRTIMSA